MHDRELLPGNISLAATCADAERVACMAIDASKP